jgi:hypothetical protein
MGFPGFSPELKIRSVYAADPNAEAWGESGRGRMKKQGGCFFNFESHTNFERAFL